MEFDGVAWVFAASTKVEKGLAEDFVCWRNIECLGRVVVARLAHAFCSRESG